MGRRVGVDTRGGRWRGLDVQNEVDTTYTELIADRVHGITSNPGKLRGEGRGTYNRVEGA
jgi:hypothetical protein